MKSIIPNINDFDTYIFDLDGTLYLGGVEIEGASNFIDQLKRAGKNVYVITNNSSKTPKIYWEHLKKINIVLKEEEVINSTTSLYKWLKKNSLEDKSYFIFGTKDMKKQLADYGIKHSEKADTVIIGNNTEFTWDEFVKASKLIVDGADYIVSNPDLRQPLKDGYYSPDAGLITEMMEKVTFIKPKIILGKPTKEMIESFIEGKTILFGDRIYTDMACAKNASISNCLVLSGEATYEDFKESKVKIDYVAKHVGEIYEENEKRKNEND